LLSPQDSFRLVRSAGTFAQIVSPRTRASTCTCACRAGRPAGSFRTSSRRSARSETRCGITGCSARLVATSGSATSRTPMVWLRTRKFRNRHLLSIQHADSFSLSLPLSRCDHSHGVGHRQFNRTSTRIPSGAGSLTTSARARAVRRARRAATNRSSASAPVGGSSILTSPSHHMHVRGITTPWARVYVYS
jgi:hypothetical protein